LRGVFLVDLNGHRSQQSRLWLERGGHLRDAVGDTNRRDLEQIHDEYNVIEPILGIRPGSGAVKSIFIGSATLALR